MQKLGFHSEWINWIMECVATVSYLIMVNDEPNGFIRPMRGIRQGDPLSPYIFIMCMEALSNALFMANQQPKSGIGIRFSRGWTVYHACYLQMTVFCYVKLTKLTVVN